MKYLYKGKETMQSQVEAYVAKYHMIKQGDKVMVGVSGGADSVCLLFVLLKLQEKLPFEVAVTHVNHGLRGAEADADEVHVKQLCVEHNLPFFCYHKDVKVIAKERKLSEEEAGREVRREAFAEAAKKWGATKIALAHHKNDNAETFFLNLTRGSGLRGLGGIRPVAGNIIRPLLCVERKDIEAYLSQSGISYCVDETNATDAYTRNRIRNHVIPYLEAEVNEGTVSHIGDAIERLQEVETYLAEQTEIYVSSCVKEEENGYILKEECYREVPSVLKPLLCRQLVARVAMREKDITGAHIQALQELMDKQVGRKVDLPYQLEAKRTYEGVWIRKKMQEDGLHAKMAAQVSYRIQKKEEIMEEEPQKSHTKWFDYDIISDGFCIRTRRAGDYITIHPDGRTQKLKSFFINQKIPEEQRDQVLLVADGSHIMWIVGYRTNPMYRVHEGTKQVLQIQVDKGEENDGRDD